MAVSGPTVSPRLVDWSLFVLLGLLVGTGLLTALAGTPGDWWVFAVHGTAALLLPVPLALKLVRVAPRLRPGRWAEGTWTSVVLGILVALSLVTGVAWTWGAPVWVADVSWITVHAVLGVAVLAALAVHLRYRFRPLRRRDVTGRRRALGVLATAALGAVVWRLQAAVVDLVFRARRFTGSRERGSLAGTAMPTTVWVADDPDPVDLSEWSLTVDGAVARPRELGAEALQDETTIRATLDCTSGWYSVQDWTGVRVEALLAAAEPAPEARYVRFVSVTGYRWSLPIEEARDALLATRVSGDPLDHGHGRPLRLVAPGRRGFQWVKWVERVEVRTTPDLGQWAAIFTSGLD